MINTHNHGPADYNRAFAIGVVLNFGFVIAEVIFGFTADSLALLADAGHNLSDVAALLLAWGASVLSRLRPTARRTYGYRSTTIIAALVNAVILLVAVGGIALESVQRFKSPAQTAGETIVIVAIILVSTWGLLKESMNLALQAVPAGIDTQMVSDYLSRLPGVTAVHDLHIWAISTTETALTAHLVKPDPIDDDVLITQARRDLFENFGIDHMTLQWERSDSFVQCGAACDPKKT
jgi:cobalt-zinc-cadmium efflux system protein